MTITPSDILELCASVADSHGKTGEAIAAAIRGIDLGDLDEAAGDQRRKAAGDQRRKYVHRKIVKGHYYVYFRMPDGCLNRLPSDETSADFRKQYARCLGRVRQLKAISKKRLRKSRLD